jgi:hypothetical protein
MSQKIEEIIDDTPEIDINAPVKEIRKEMMKAVA